MATTHVLIGVAVGGLSLLFAPDFAVVAAIAGGAGGLFPDLDLYFGHRKTLHFPVYYPAMAIPALGIALAHSTGATIVAAFFFAGAAAHASLDVLGGGLELRPWQGTSERAVYDHARGRWLKPQRVIRYDGSPEDLGLAFLVGGSSLVMYGPPVSQLVTLALAVSVGYTLLRRPLAEVAPVLAGHLPPRLHPYVPGRYHDSPPD